MKGYDFTNLKNNLIKKGYVVKTFENKELAVKYLEEEITCKTVGFGGSVTLSELNLFEALSKNAVFRLPISISPPYAPGALFNE